MTAPPYLKIKKQNYAIKYKPWEISLCTDATMSKILSIQSFGSRQIILKGEKNC